MRSEFRSLARTAPALAMLLAVAGCATQPKLGMEAPGRPEVTWKNEPVAGATAPDSAAQADTERELVAAVRDAEQKESDSLTLARRLYELAILRRQQGAYDEAERLYRRALAIRERNQGPNAPDVALVLNNLAGLEVARGRYDAAQPLLERALSVRRTALGPEHRLTAESQNNLALLYAAQGNAAAAEPLYQQAIAILQQPTAPHTEDVELERVLDNYAALLRDTGRDEEAVKLEAQVRGLRAVKGAPTDSAP